MITIDSLYKEFPDKILFKHISFKLKDNMRVAIDEVRNQNKICEGTICYTNDVTDPNEKKYTLKYYINLVKIKAYNISIIQKDSYNFISEFQNLKKNFI